MDLQIAIVDDDESCDGVHDDGGNGDDGGDGDDGDENNVLKIVKALVEICQCYMIIIKIMITGLNVMMMIKKIMMMMMMMMMRMI